LYLNVITENTVEQLKIEYTIDIEDIKSVDLEASRKGYLYILSISAIISLIISALYSFEDFNFTKFVQSLFYSFLFFSVFYSCVLFIPAFFKSRKNMKVMKADPNKFGQRTLEINENEIYYISEKNSSMKSFKWKEIKKMSTTKNYAFLTHKDKFAILFPNNNPEFTAKAKEYFKKSRIA